MHLVHTYLARVQRRPVERFHIPQQVQRTCRQYDRRVSSKAVALGATLNKV